MSGVKIKTTAGWVELAESGASDTKLDTTVYDAHVNGSGDRHPTNQIDFPIDISVINTANLQQALNHIWSAGVIDGCDVSVGVATGTVEMTEGTMLMRQTDDPNGELIVQYVAARDTGSPIVIPDNTQQYIYAQWQGVGTYPLIKVTDFVDLVNGSTHVFVAHVVRHGDVIDIINSGHFTTDNPWKSALMHFNLGMKHVPGGTMVNAFNGETTFTITPGAFYLGIKKLSQPSFDSLGIDTFTYWYETAPGVWVSQAGQSNISDTQYQDGTGLVAIPNNDYATSWVYCTISDNLPDEYGKVNVHVVYGYDVYNTQSAAEEEDKPARLPSVLNSVTAQIVARFVVQESAGIVQTVSAYDSTINNSPATVHNALSGLQGGAADEMYHLTANQLTAVNAIGEDVITGYVTKTVGSGKDFPTINDAVEWLIGKTTASGGRIKFELDAGIHRLSKLTGYDDYYNWVWSFISLQNISVTFSGPTSNSADVTICVDSGDANGYGLVGGRDFFCRFEYVTLDPKFENAGADGALNGGEGGANYSMRGAILKNSYVYLSNGGLFRAYTNADVSDNVSYEAYVNSYIHFQDAQDFRNISAGTIALVADDSSRIVGYGGLTFTGLVPGEETNIPLNTEQPDGSYINDNTGLVLKGYGEAINDYEADSGFITINPNDGNVVTLIVNGDTDFTFTNTLADSQTFQLILSNAGDHAITFSTEIKWPGGVAPTFTSGEQDLLIFTRADNTWFGSVSNDMRVPA